MNNAFFNNPAIAAEPLSVAYHVEDPEGPYSGTRTATVYKRGRLEHWPDGSVWAFEWRVVTKITKTGLASCQTAVISITTTLRLQPIRGCSTRRWRDEQLNLSMRWLRLRSRGR